MEKYSVELPNCCAVSFSPYTFTVQDSRGNRVTLNLTKQQMSLIEARFKRNFYIKCKEEALIYYINNANTTEELEAVAKKYDLSDCCDFSDINIFGIKRMLKVVAKCLYRYPKIRSNFCFLGTHDGYKKKIDRLLSGDVSALREFRLEYICDADIAVKLGGMVDGIITPLIGNDDAYIATTVHAFGLFDSILFDKNDYDGFKYLQLIRGLREDEKSGFHPKGCSTPESVVYHEIGHMLDGKCNLSDSLEFTSFYSRMTPDMVEREVSGYATTSPKELIAESFAEYMCNDTPRPCAKAVVDMLNAKYKKV